MRRAAREIRRAALAFFALLSAGCGQSLHDLAARGDLEAASAKIAADAGAVHSTNDLGKTPLHYAVTFKQLPAMALLLEHGADINAQDRTGMTPLHVAAMLGRKDEAEWLLAHGADLEVRDSFGDTPLHTAALFGMGQVIGVLKARGADFAARNKNGKTALELAREQGKERAAAYIERLAAGT